MATAHIPPASGSSISTRLSASEEVQEYEKILRISDDIFSGTHPRLKVPQQFVRKPASRIPPTSTSTPAQVKSGDQLKSPPKTQPPPSAPSATTRPANSQAPSAGSAPSGATGPSRILPKPASEIDPIFLTKSDDLVRAELQLQRQRVERVLREQLEQKRQESRQKAALQDAKPDFDVSDVLVKAFEMVNPSPSIDAPGAGEPSDSFDENSFYSSRAPDSPQHGEQPRQSPAPPQSNSEELATEAPAENYSDELQRLEALNRTGSDQDMQDTYPVADHLVPYDQRHPHHGEVDVAARKYPEPNPPTDAFEEPEYSPPAPGVAPMERDDNYGFQRGYPGGTKRRAPEGRAPERPRHARRSLSPGSDVRIVRNHITSPAAPQPSRVSPLAIAKVPPVHQVKDSRPDYGPERHASPEAPVQPLTSRKRRRLDERDRARPSYTRAPAALNVEESYIKEEPVSPPPFTDTPQAYRSRQPQVGPVYIDIASPHYTPVLERREAPVRDPAYEYEVYDPHGDPGGPRTVSRLSARRPIRDDQDLRRVASLHQARQPEYAREYVDQASPQSIRAGSYAIVERPPPERIRYYDELAAPPARRYVPVGESPTSPRLHEAYYEDEAATRMMAPPPRRIVVDDHGNQYYETLPGRLQPIVPPPSRLPRSDVYDDRAPLHHASVRAASVLEDPYSGRRYVQDMPPPQAAYRRVTDYARPAPSEWRPYGAALDEREPFPRSASVQVTEYGTRRPPYLEEAELPRERIVRMPSVRPPTSRYEEPQVIQRVESVRPGGRDVSVYVDDGARQPREYVERPVYVATRPLREERYYDGSNPERVILEGGRDVVHRVPQRY